MKNQSPQRVQMNFLLPVNLVKKLKALPHGKRTSYVKDAIEQAIKSQHLITAFEAFEKSGKKITMKRPSIAIKLLKKPEPNTDEVKNFFCLRESLPKYPQTTLIKNIMRKRRG